ncbi:MAG: hypothetical protein ACR2MN_11455 [Acidimicrobiales bacterium]
MPKGQHFIVEAAKSVVTESGGGPKKLKSGGSSGLGGDYSGGGNIPIMFLQQHDLYEKLQDPRLHGYLHDAEKTQNIEPAYELDHRRLTQLVTRLGAIPHGGDKATRDAAIRNLADGLKRLEIPSSLAALHPLALDGGSADEVVAALTLQGVKNPMEAVNAGAPGAVAVSAKATDPVIKQTYVDNWTRFTAAHEFGHMVGLIDEYYMASSAETVKGMISADLLPPDTRSDHLRLDASPTAKEHAKEKVGQAHTQDLLQRAGLESPDFALNAPNKGMSKTTSIMTGGFDVTQVHMSTAWEALVEMTKPHVDEKYWRFS